MVKYLTNQGEFGMDKEIKGLIGEIISLVLLLVIVIPICVNASSDYREKKEQMIFGNQTSVDISNKGDIKKVTVISEYDGEFPVQLMLKISKFSDEYLVYLDEQVFNIKDLEYTEDEEYQYYNLGIYEVDGKREFDFKLQVKDKSYYDETISYSFYTEGLL